MPDSVVPHDADDLFGETNKLRGTAPTSACIISLIGTEVTVLCAEEADKFEYKGILSHCSPKFDIRLTHCQKFPVIDNNDNVTLTKGNLFRQITLDSKNVISVSGSLSHVEKFLNKRKGKSFVTDAQISQSAKICAEVREDYFEEWVPEDENADDLEDANDRDNNTNGSGSHQNRQSSGWSAAEMFDANKKFGLKTDFAEDLSQYTTVSANGTAEEVKRANELAEKIENDASSKHYAMLENDDEERSLDVVTRFESKSYGRGDRGQKNYSKVRDTDNCVNGTPEDFQRTKELAAKFSNASNKHHDDEERSFDAPTRFENKSYSRSDRGQKSYSKTRDTDNWRSEKPPANTTSSKINVVEQQAAMATSPPSATTRAANTSNNATSTTSSKNNAIETSTSVMPPAPISSVKSPAVPTTAVMPPAIPTSAVVPPAIPTSAVVPPALSTTTMMPPTAPTTNVMPPAVTTTMPPVPTARASNTPNATLNIATGTAPPSTTSNTATSTSSKFKFNPDAMPFVPSKKDVNVISPSVTPIMYVASAAPPLQFAQIDQQQRHQQQLAQQQQQPQALVQAPQQYNQQAQQQAPQMYVTSAAPSMQYAPVDQQQRNQQQLAQQQQQPQVLVQTPQQYNQQVQQQPPQMYVTSAAPSMQYAPIDQHQRLQQQQLAQPLPYGQQMLTNAPNGAQFSKFIQPIYFNPTAAPSLQFAQLDQQQRQQQQLAQQQQQPQALVQTPQQYNPQAQQQLPQVYVTSAAPVQFAPIDQQRQQQQPQPAQPQPYGQQMLTSAPNGAQFSKFMHPIYFNPSRFY